MIAGVGEGLGYALGKCLAKAGYNFALVARNAERLVRLADEIKAAGGLRQVAQSMARELGPKHIHIAHVVIDGTIDIAAVRARFAECVKEMLANAMLDSDAIAEAFYAIDVQASSAWTFETALRPYSETFKGTGWFV